MLQTVRKLLSLSFSIFLILFFAATVPASLRAQSGYSAQLSGVISDSSGGGVPDAKVTLVDEDTGIARTYATDNRGIYVFTGVRPATYTIRVESANFATQERKGLTLAVSQQASLDFGLSPKTVTEKVVVTEQAPLLDTGNASLGTDVTNEYVRDIPLVNRSFFSLVFLAGGVTETAGQGTEDSYPSGTNFVSNGQRNATAEVRVDGALTSAPEQGEGATTNVYYQPSVEIVQEFKVENNSFSAEYGNNGGTVVNIVLKEGKNKLHGSGWWFGQRSAMDANEFFRNKFDIPNPDHARDQYGFSLGGPIKKEKTFFFIDFEKTRQNDPVNIDAFVPTALERAGDFRNTQVICSDSANGCTAGEAVQQRIFNPRNVDIGGNRQDFAVPNVIDSGLIDPIGQAIINLYPQPTVDDAGPGEFNYHAAVLSKFSARQFDIKLDHHFSEKNRISGRYSNHQRRQHTHHIRRRRFQRWLCIFNGRPQRGNRAQLEPHADDGCYKQSRRRPRSGSGYRELSDAVQRRSACSFRQRKWHFTHSRDSDGQQRDFAVQPVLYGHAFRAHALFLRLLSFLGEGTARLEVRR